MASGPLRSPTSTQVHFLRLTHLEAVAVPPWTEAECWQVVSLLTYFCYVEGLDWTRDKDLDIILAKFFDLLFEEGSGLRLGLRTVPALEHLLQRWNDRVSHRLPKPTDAVGLEVVAPCVPMSTTLSAPMHCQHPGDS